MEKLKNGRQETIDPGSGTTTALLECRGIVRNFSKNGHVNTVLRGVGFSLEPGRTALITGKSGTGKSVLLWLLALLDTPTAGSISLDGKDLCGMPEERLSAVRRENVRIIFQDFNLVRSWTALENVTAAFAGTRISPREQRERAEGILSDLGLAERLDYLPSELSIGQRQRVAIARTLVIPPRLILADEPTGGVDPETGSAIIRLLVEHTHHCNAGLVVATHGIFPPEAADSVYELTDGVLTAV